MTSEIRSDPTILFVYDFVREECEERQRLYNIYESFPLNDLARRGLPSIDVFRKYLAPKVEQIEGRGLISELEFYKLLDDYTAYAEIEWRNNR